MRQWRGTAAWIVMLASCSTLGVGCDSPDEPPVVTLTPGTGSAVVGGQSVTLVADVTVAGNAAQDVTVLFSSTTSGIVITPASVATNDHGEAQAHAFVPYGVTALCTAATGDGVSDIKPLPTTAVTIALMRGTTDLVGGQMMSITASATDSVKKPLPGVVLAFASNATGVSFAPASVATNETGSATATAFVPFSANGVVAVVSGGGSGSTTALSPTVAELSIKGSASGTPAFGGTVITVNAKVSEDKASLEGFPVAFATTASGVAFSPATSFTAVTQDDATVVEASSQAFVPYGAATLAIVSAAGASSVVSFADQLPALTIKAPSIAPPVTGTPATSGSSSGLLYSISVKVTDGKVMGASGLAGVPLTFTATNGATFTPAAAVTDGDGKASSTMFIANIANAPNSPGNSRVIVTGPAGAVSPTLEVP